MEAYVLVQTNNGADPIAGQLEAVPGVLFAEDVRGAYDALAVARSDHSEAALQGVLAEIRGLPGVLHAVAAPRVPAPSAVRDAA